MQRRGHEVRSLREMRRARVSNGAPCQACDGRGFGAPVACVKCKAAGVTEEFFQDASSSRRASRTARAYKSPANPSTPASASCPSKIFTRDGATITSVLKLTVAQATEGGFFDAETLHGAEPVFVEGGAKTGDTKTLEGKGLPKGKGDGRGNHVVRLEVARAPTPEPEPEPESKPRDGRDGCRGGWTRVEGGGAGRGAAGEARKDGGWAAADGGGSRGATGGEEAALLAALEAKTGGT